MSDVAVVPIELRVWRQFLTLAETLHFGRAADKLHITQPPLTLAIQQLESRLGVLLFERSRRQVALTPAGEALVEPARRMLKQACALPAIAQDAARGGAGRLRLGFVSTVGFGPLPEWLRAFRKAEPGVNVELREATTDVQLQALAAGDADAGLILHAPGVAPAMERFSTGLEPLVLALPESLPMARARKWNLSELWEQSLIIFPRAVAPSVFDAVLSFYHAHGRSPAIAQEAIQMQTIVNLVSAGLGVAWVPQSMMQLRRPGVAYRQLSPSMSKQAPWCETSLVWGAQAAPVVRRFVDIVVAAVADRTAALKR